MRSTCYESCHISILDCPVKLWSQPWLQSTAVLMEAGVAAHLQQHLLPPPSPSKSWASQMASPGACCFHLSGAADPLRSLHPWEARFLSSLVPFQILIEVCGRWHLGECPGYDPCHLLEPVLCSNSPTGS